MTPYQRVAEALAHRESEELPFTWGFGPTPESAAELRAALKPKGFDWDLLREAVEDVVWLHPEWAGAPLPEPHYMTIWGIRTRRAEYGTGGYDEVEHAPLADADSIDQIASYPWPSADDFDYTCLKRQWREKDPEGEKAIRVSGGNPLEIYTWMTGMEEAMINLATNPELVTAALKKINRFFMDRLERTIAALDRPVRIVQCADDLGSQTGLLISRSMYRELVQPIHRELFAHAHRTAPEAKVFMHSDGAVFDILPDVIEAGVDGLEAVQVDAAGMAPHRLKETYGSSLCFQGAISVQTLLPHGSTNEVRLVCRETSDVMRVGGGWLAAPTHAIQVGTPADNILAMLESLLGEDRWTTAQKAARLL